MKRYLRSPLVSFAALALYVLVHVLAAGLHHHHGTPDRAGNSATIGDTTCYTAAPADLDNDDEGTCLLCSVLHSPQALPALCEVEAAVVVCDRELSLPPVILSYPKTTTRSRAPPR